MGAPSSVSLAKQARYETGAVLRLLRDQQQPDAYRVYVMAGDGQSQVGRGGPQPEANKK